MVNEKSIKTMLAVGVEARGEAQPGKVDCGQAVGSDFVGWWCEPEVVVEGLNGGMSRITVGGRCVSSMLIDGRLVLGIRGR